MSSIGLIMELDEIKLLRSQGTPKKHILFLCRRLFTVTYLLVRVFNKEN